MFSAYDLKKILPRAIFALVAVNLSWGLMSIFIKAIDVLGNGAEKLITAPFGDLATYHIGAGGAAGALSFAVIGGLGAAFGLIPILGVAITGLFGILFAFAIALIRRVLIIGLIVIAPVAIALSVFPQTEKWAKEWWEWFSKLLLMYPFIMAFFGLSQVAAGLISQTQGTGPQEAIFQLAALALLVLPYFFVGKALSLAGGAIGKVAGMVNNKDRGIIDKTKKYEAGKVADRRYDAARGQRYGGRNFATKGINTSLRSLRHPNTAIGKKEDRDARILSLIKEGAGTMEERHAGAKALNRSQLSLLGQISDESEKATVIEKMAEAEAKDESGVLDTAKQAQVRARLNAEYAQAKNAVGGTIDGQSQLYALQKGVQEGFIKPEDAAKGVERLSQKLGTKQSQRGRVAQDLATHLDTVSIGGKGQSVLSERSVASHVTANAYSGTGTAPAAANIVTPDSVNKVYNGPKAASQERLASLSPEDFTEISKSKKSQVATATQLIPKAKTPADKAKLMEDIAGHRADILFTGHAAASNPAGNSGVVNSSRETLTAIDSELNNAVASGALTAIERDQILAESYSNASSRAKPIL